MRVIIGFMSPSSCPSPIKGEGTGVGLASDSFYCYSIPVFIEIASVRLLTANLAMTKRGLVIDAEALNDNKNYRMQTELHKKEGLFSPSL